MFDSGDRGRGGVEWSWSGAGADHFPNLSVSSVDSVNQVVIKPSSSVNY